VPVPPERCPRCLFPPGFCLCEDVPRLEAPFRLVVVRHASERVRLSNTARWAALALGAHIVEHGIPGAPLDEAPLRAPGARVLFPSPHPSDADPHPPPRVLVVPDGTWPQSRRMMQRIAALRTLPRLSLAGPPAGIRLRRPPAAHGMSTLEAIAGALAACGAAGAAERLLALHDLGVERVLRLKGTWDGAAAAERALRRAG
jgi:tRNA-uridine aminocarboxypropyltransferase